MKTCISLTACLLLGILLTGCRGSKPIAMPEPLRIQVSGAPNINDTGAGPNAATVRIYQLTNTTNFERVTPEQFWSDDKAALDDELITSQQLRLFPNQVELVTLEPEENTIYIGVAANLRRPDPDAWRQVYSVEELRNKHIRITVGAGNISLVVQ